LTDCDAGLLIIDVTDPFYPYVVASDNPEGTTDCIAVAGTHAYIGDFLFGLRVLDVSDSEDPRNVGGIVTQSYAYGVDFDGDHVYLATSGNQGGLTIAPSQCESAAAVSEETCVARSLSVLSPSPNPTTGLTALQMLIPRDGAVRLMVLDATGRQVRLLADGQFSAGLRDVFWDGRDDEGRLAASGIYFARLMWEGSTETTRMVLVRQ
jgi:hypothetical protein